MTDTVIQNKDLKVRYARFDNMDKLHAMSEALLMYETIDKDQIDDIMSGVKPRPPKGWDDDNDDNDKKTSSQEQVKNSGFTDTANSH